MELNYLEQCFIDLRVPCMYWVLNCRRMSEFKALLSNEVFSVSVFVSFRQPLICSRSCDGVYLRHALQVVVFFPLHSKTKLVFIFAKMPEFVRSQEGKNDERFHM